MICNLSVQQQEGILDISRKIIRKDVNQSTEDILKKVYDVAYHSLINGGKEVKTAQEYGVALTSFVAETLHELAQIEKDNNVLTQFGVNLNREATVNAIAYTNPAEVKKLVGIQEQVDLPRNLTKFSKEQETLLKKNLAKIKESFPKLSKPIQFARKVVGGKSIDTVLLRTVENGEPLFHISLFAKNLAPRVNTPSVKNEALIPDGAGFEEALAYGNMVDYGVRTIFQHKNKSFSEVREQLKNDPALVNAFSAYSLGKNKAEVNPTGSPAFNAYFDQFLDDLVLTASKIETEYKGYHISDLSDVIENSGLSESQKQNFYIYSKKLGLIGELDLLAIKPDGSFRVIDIKTSKDTLSEKNKRDYLTQISAYAQILGEATGLKPEPHGDIFLVQKSYRTILDNIRDNHPDNRRKVVLTSLDKISEPLLTEEQLAQKAEAYRKQQLTDLTTVDKVSEEKAPTSKKVQILSVQAALKRRQQQEQEAKNKPSPDPLNMKVREGEALSTKESIQQQVEWLEQIFPELKGNGIQVVPTLLSSAGGQFFLDGITLAQKSNEGVGYHEGWHRFSQVYLTKEEKVQLYEGVQKAALDFRDREGNSINTKEANFKEVEEFLAEEFRKFALNPSSYHFPQREVKGIFQKIWAFLQSLLGHFQKNGATAYEELFRKLHDGTFYRGNYSMDNAFWSRMNSFYRNTRKQGEQVMSNTTFLQYRDFADGYLNEYMMTNGMLLSSLLSKGGLAELTQTLQKAFQDMRDINQENLEVEDTPQIREAIEDLSKINDTFDDFMRAYLKTTNFATLRRYVGANTEMASRIIDQETMDPVAKSEEEGEKKLENTTSEADDNLTEFNRSGNEVSAEELASDIVKDFMNGIPELTINQKLPEGASYQDYALSNDKGLPVYLNKSKAFYKTLQLLEGHFTWDLIEGELKNPANYEKFPELQIIHDRLFGENGILTRLRDLTQDIDQKKYEGQELADKLDEQRKLKEFKDQFEQAMTLPKVRYETLRKNYEAPVDELLFDSKNTRKYNPVQTVENSESILTAIINDFGKGFQENARQEHERMAKAGEPFMDLFDAFTHALTLSEQDRMKLLGEQKYLYDSVMKTYHLNPFYVQHNFAPAVFNDQFSTGDIRAFFELHGINLNPRAYENNEKEIRNAFVSMKAVASAYHTYVNTLAEGLKIPNYNGSSWIREAKKINQLKQELKDLTGAATLDENAISDKQIQLFEQQRKVRYIASKLFTTKPIDELLYRDDKRKQDDKAKKEDYRKAFALSLPTFLNLAKVQKDYREYFSSGSMLVGDATQFSYFLPNQMLLISKLIQHGVKSFDDFDKYPEISHLNPKRNPQFHNSWILSKLFDTDKTSPNYGQRLDSYQMSISVLSQVSTNNEDGSKESKKMSELSLDEKLLTDFLLVTREGSSEIRRLETSNTGYRISVVNTAEGRYDFVKPVTILNKNFDDPVFLGKVRGYLLSAISNYAYDLTKEDSPKRLGQRGLSIFDELLGTEVSDQLKSLVAGKVKENPSYDWNEFFNDLQTQTDDPLEVTTGDRLFKKVNEQIARYFEGIAITGDNSIHKQMAQIWSDKTKKELVDLAVKFKGITKVSDVIKSEGSDFHNFEELHADPGFKRQVRDFIANDFIMAMEDSLLFFGDYSYYTDPIKRRKIIGNNGVIGITDASDAEIEKMQIEKGGLQSVWMQHKGIKDMEKNYRLVRKALIGDMKMPSSLLKVNPETGKPYLIDELKDYYRQVYPKNQLDLMLANYKDQHPEESKDKGEEELLEGMIRDRKVNVLSAFSKMELGDGGAYVSLDLYRKLRQKSNNWTDRDEDEFQRQKLILKQKLGGELSAEEQNYVQGGPYSSFNIAKFALTGPVYSEQSAPLRPTFDKMGLKPMLPESDWESKNHLFTQMLSKGIDYLVYDSASKGYQSAIHEVWNPDYSAKKTDINYTEHAGGFMKLQQNTAAVKDESNFAVQLRGTFFSIMLLHQQNGTNDPILQGHYRDFLSSLRQYVALNGKQQLASIGLDHTGNFLQDEGGEPIGKKLFVEKIREQLINIGSTDLSLLDKLNVGKDGDFVHFMEALPLNREIYNIVSGILDDGLRKVKMNGSKMYQTMELGSGPIKGRLKEEGGTLGLKWHGLIRDQSGKIIGVSPVECKIAFKKNFRPLLELTHPDGARIATLNRLNTALNSDEWREQHKDSLTMVGIRIPLQDMNFTSHMIIRQFLPKSEGDTIIVPPEFYKQVGADNDIDTVTTSFQYLDKDTGKPILRPKESYADIVSKLSELRTKLNNKPAKIVSSEVGAFNDRIAQIRERILQENLFGNAGKSLADLEEELTVEDTDGYKTFRGLKSNKSVLGKAMKNGLHPELMEDLNELVDDLNEGGEPSLQDPSLIRELKSWSKKERAYKKGLNNEIIRPIIQFLSHPLSYDYLTETDSIAPVEELAKEALSLHSGEKATDIALNENKSSLTDLGYSNNLINHKNNFQVRTMLGAIVKFSRLFTTLVQTGTTLNQRYISSSVANLAKVSGDMKSLKALPKGFYERTIWTPFLTRKTNQKITLSLFDEEQERMTKNLSMLASSELDLFKNIETFPSLGISWNNIKPLFFLMAQGVPMNKAVLFLNNPITQLVEENKNELGPDFQLRHALVKTSQDSFGGAVHPIGLGGYDYEINGKPNTFMKRFGQASEAYLNQRFSDVNDFRLDPETVNEFTKAFNDWRRDQKGNRTSDLKTFLAKQGSEYKELAETLMAYYGTLVEDGDHFYQMVIKKLDRDSVKYNNQAQIAESKRSENALKQSGMVNRDFFEKIKQDSVFAPFYQDGVVENAIQAFMPHLYNKDIAGWVEGIKNMIATITGEIYGSSEDKRRVENKIVADLMEYVYKNFFVLNVGGRYNTLYEFFERDIIPELKNAQIQALVYKNQEVDTDGRTLDKLKGKIGDSDTPSEEQSEYLSGYTMFANQIDLLRAKYPELGELKIVQALQARRTTPQVEYEPPMKRSDEDEEENDAPDEQRAKKKRNVTISEIFNTFSQMYLNMNLSTDPQTKFVDEQQVRDEWDKLVNFTPQTFSSVYSKIVQNNREEVYSNPENAAEIRTFFKLLSYYALVENSHLDRSNGSFAYLAPTSEITQVVEGSLKNFEQAMKGLKPQTVTKLLGEFEQTFRQMNPELNLKIDGEGGVGYKRDKVKSGKLYSKATMANQTINTIKNHLLRQMADQVSGKKNSKVAVGYNNFLINNETEEKNPFTDCKGN
jgi:hypothetical protein